MHDCTYFAELISAGIDAELTADETIELEAHLKQCENCRRLQEAMRSVSDAGFDDEAEPPEHFTADVMKRVRAQRRRDTVREVFRPNPAIMISAAVFLLLLIGSTTLGRYLPFTKSTNEGASAASQGGAEMATDNAAEAAQESAAKSYADGTNLGTSKSTETESSVDKNSGSQTGTAYGVADSADTKAAMSIMDGLYARGKTVFSSVWDIEASSSDLYPANGTPLDADFVPDGSSAFILSVSDWTAYLAELQKAGIAVCSVTPDGTSKARSAVSASDKVLVIFTKE